MLFAKCRICNAMQNRVRKDAVLPVGGSSRTPLGTEYYSSGRSITTSPRIHDDKPKLTFQKALRYKPSVLAMNIRNRNLEYPTGSAWLETQVPAECEIEDLSPLEDPNP